jgi:hypothetical protein
LIQPQGVAEFFPECTTPPSFDAALHPSLNSIEE